MKKKLFSGKGETLTETLVSVLIVALASVVLASMLTTATKLNREAKDKDDTLYDYISDMEEAVSSPVTVTVTVEGNTITIS